MKNRINPIGLKGNEINERMKTLMGISTLNENKSNIVVELTKLGPDNKVYAIIRENHEYYIKSTDKVSNIVSEDFKYIGGLQNKKQEAYSSYAKAIKFLNLKFNSLAEAHDKNNSVNAFLNDDLLTENGLAGGFSDFPKGGGFSGAGNLEGNESLYEEEEEEGIVAEYNNQDDEPYYDDVKPTKKSPSKKRWDDDEDEDDESLNEIEQAIDDMSSEKEEEVSEKINENKLSISRAIRNMDAIIDSLSEGKKKVYTLK